MVEQLVEQNERKVTLTVPTLCTSTQIADREPGWRLPGGRSSSYSGVPNSNTLAMKHNFRQHHTPARFPAKVRTCPEHPDNPWWTLKRDEHKRNPSVLLDMSYRLGPTARQVFVPHRVGLDALPLDVSVVLALCLARVVDKPERVFDALGRHIDVLALGQRGGGYVEEVLGFDPLDQASRDVVIK